MSTHHPAIRIYVAGPYTAPTPEGVEAHCRRAAEMAAAIFDLGHHAFCPHAATHPIHAIAPQDYETWMAFDLSILERWAQAIFVIGDSPGVRREHARALELGLAAYTHLAQIPKR